VKRRDFICSAARRRECRLQFSPLPVRKANPLRALGIEMPLSVLMRVSETIE
jgi:hypothetical protein